jgi:hypothetical protein
MNKPLFFLFAAALFLSANLIIGMGYTFLKLLLPRIGGSPDLALSLGTLAPTALAPLGGQIFALIFLNLRFWHAQQLIYMFLWAMALLLQILPFGRVPDSLLWLQCLPVVLAIGLCSANHLLLPRWYAMLETRDEQTSPGTLFPFLLAGISYSGAASGIITYTFLIEPVLDSTPQFMLWKVVYCVVFVLLAVCVALSWKTRPKNPERIRAYDRTRPRLIQLLRWTILSTVATGLGLAYTGCLSAELTPFPISWGIPTVLFWFALALAFVRPSGLGPAEFRWSIGMQALSGLAVFGVISVDFLMEGKPLLIIGALAAAVFIYVPHRFTFFFQPITTTMALYLFFNPIDLDSIDSILPPFFLHTCAFWFACWGVIGLIGRDRPSPIFIPELLFCIALGSLLGSISIGVLFPIIFSATIEYPLLLILACILRFLPAPLSVNRSQMRICD